MRSLSLLIKPVSGACMYACRYCFYADEMQFRASGLLPPMSVETLETLVRKAFAACDGNITMAFQGGEPLLAGLDFYEKLLSFEKKYRKTQSVSHSVQTNGALIDEAWADFFARNGFLVGLSLDGPEALHDACRVDRAGEGTYARTVRAARLLTEKKVMFNVLCVVSRANVDHADLLWRELAPYGYLQFIPCLNGFETEDGFAPTDEEYGRFLIRVYDLYEKAIYDDRYVSVRYFDNLLRMLQGGRPESCAMNGRCSVSLTVESDGSLYPCDFYVLDFWCLGRIGDTDLAEAVLSRTAQEFVNSSVYMDLSCRSCARYSLCRGGCRREREPFENGRPALNRYCRSYRMFFDACLPRLRKLSGYVRGFTDR